MIDMRFHGGMASMVAAIILYLIQSAATLFAVPPPSPRDIARVAFEALLALPMGFILGYGFAMPAATALTAILSPLGGGTIVIDNIGAGIIVGLFSVKALQLFFDVLIEVAVSKLKGLKND